MKISGPGYYLLASAHLMFCISIIANEKSVSTSGDEHPAPQNYWIKAIDEHIVLMHNFTLERFNTRHRSFDWQWPLDASVSKEQMHTACSFIHVSAIDQSAASSIEEDLRVHGLDSYIFYSKRGSNIQCSITKSTVTEIGCLALVDNWHMHAYPSVLKIDPSLVNYFISPQTFIKSKDVDLLLKETKEIIALPYSLSIEWAPYSLSSDSSMNLFKRLVGAYLQADRKLESTFIPFFDTIALQSESLHDAGKPDDASFPYAWESILFKYRSIETARKRVDSQISSSVGEMKTHRNCVQVINRGIVETVRYFSRSVEIDDVLRLFDGNMHCLVLLVHFASTSVDVLRLSIIPANTLSNYQARGITQGGKIEMESYRDAGLTGKGQICGVADSGLNDLSCFFVDTSNQYSTITTNRSGLLEPLRRKVIQYTSFADSFDDLGGHGTHVCGSIAGSSVSEFSSMNGMAPEAKLAFFDLGMTERSFLKVPALTDIFQSAYDAGARVHSNSWGNLGGLYGQMSYDLDEFTYDHPDFLVLFAGGNFGSEGTKSIISPANAKNVLTVGAGQVRSVFLDSPLGESMSAVASFSSVGPTYDGRIKPDIIAPGDFIESAFSGSPDLLYRALEAPQNSLDWTKLSSCAVHQMSGTSMATPITSGTALLIRQYFMDADFWASICNPLYASCRDGPFTPSGFLLKALFLHSGQAIGRYSDTAYDSEGGYFSSFLLEQPPDPFQGYGEIVLKNILPLKGGKGLHPLLDLVIFDHQEIGSYAMMDFVVEFKGNVSAVGEQPLKITLTWYDPPSIMGSSSSLLIHDLDLIVQSPSGELFSGNLGRSTQRDLDNIRTDDVNTNEQVMIRQPSCYVKSDSPADCKYTIRVQSYALTKKRVQQFALVITTKGEVSGPISSPLDPVKTSQKQRLLSASPTAALLESSLRLNAVLMGSEVASATVQVDFCSFLIGAQVRVLFDGSPSNLTGEDRSQVDVDTIVPTGDDEPAQKESDAAIKVPPQPAMPSNLELTILDSNRKGVAIGGVDLSMGIARFITEWPDDWISSKAGVYEGYIGLREAGLHGRGLWKAYMMNSFSSSARGRFNMTVQLKFESQPLASTADSARLCGDENASPAAVPSPKPTRSSQSSQINIDLAENASTSKTSSSGSGSTGTGGSYSGTDQLTEKVVVPIRGISLASKVVNKVISQDRILLSAFNQSGRLCALHLSLDAYDSNSLPTRGSSGWLLAVIIKAPNGLVAQVGGYEWLGYDDRFYQRRWPDVWVGKDSGGRRWLAERDLHSSGLTSLLAGAGNEIVAHKHSQHTWETLPLYATPKPLEWTVELALGYPFGVRPSTNYSGSLTLSFWPWKSSESKSHTAANNSTARIDRANSSIPTNGTLNGHTSRDILSIWTSRRGLVLATFLILSILIYSKWVQCCKGQDDVGDGSESNFAAIASRMFSRTVRNGANSAREGDNIIYSQIDMQSDRFFRAAPAPNVDSSIQQDNNSDNNSFRRFSGGTNHRNIELVELRSDSKRKSYGSTEV